MLAALLALAVVLALWAYQASVLLFAARARAGDAREVLAGLAEVEPLEADLDQVRHDLDVASADLAAARRNLSSPWLAPLRPLPVAGRQLASAQALARSAETLSRSLAPAVGRVVEGRRAEDRDEQRMAILAGLERDLREAALAIADVDLGPDEGLIAPLAEARAVASEEVAELGRAVDEALVVVRGLRSLMGGSSYLVLAANPAEMGNAGGLFLSVGELRAEAGDLDLDHFLHASELFPISPPVVVDVDVRERWGHLSPGDDFRKLNLTPRFAEYIGPQGLAMWEASAGQRPDGVMAVDPVVVQALLEVVGEVEVEGRVYDADSLLAFAVEEQYAEFSGGQDQDERRELVSRIAQAAVDAMGERSWDPLDLVRSMRGPAAGRHLLAYSEEPAQQAMWTALGVDGRMDGDEVLVNLASVGGHKTDALVAVAVSAEVGDRGDERVLRLAVELTNNTPPGIEGHAAGVVEALGEEPGTYLGRLVVFTPAATRQVTITPDVPLEATGRDGPLVVTATRVTLAAGETQRFDVEVVLASALSSVTVLPSGRVPGVSWRFEGDEFQDEAPRALELE